MVESKYSDGLFDTFSPPSQHNAIQKIPIHRNVYEKFLPDWLDALTSPLQQKKNQCPQIKTPQNPHPQSIFFAPPRQIILGFSLQLDHNYSLCVHDPFPLSYRNIDSFPN